ncbi:MAG: lactate racemase domain-containing protein [candidate division WOR-3 bacterium]
MNKKINITYGDEKITLLVPKDFLAGEVIKPRESSPLMSEEEMKKKIEESLQKPINSKKLNEIVKNKKVGLLINDGFRPGLQKLIVEVMLREIFKGKPLSLKVFIATGTHNPEVYGRGIAEFIKRRAEEMNKEVFVITNDCEKGEFIYLGETPFGTKAEVLKEWLETDSRIYAHESKYHYMNGYSVFDKQVCPGLSSWRTIESTHKHALREDLSAPGRIPYHKVRERQRNPFAEDNRYVRLLSERYVLKDGKLKEENPPVFLLDMISTPFTIKWIASGDPEIVSREMTEVVDKLSSFEIPRTKYVVISPGGPPFSDTLYGTQICLDMALKNAIEEGGEALILAPCKGDPNLPLEVRGLGPSEKVKELFWDNLVRLRKLSLQEATEWIKKNFELYLWKTDRLLKFMLKQKVKLYLYSELPREKIEPGGFLFVEDPNEWIKERAKRRDGKLRIIDEGNKVLIMSSK